MKKVGFGITINQKPKLPDRLDEALAYFLGLLITDGHIVLDNINKRYKVMLFNSYDDESEIILSLIRKLFDYNAKINIRTNISFSKRPNNEIYITSKKVVEFLTEKMNIPSGAKSRVVRIPKLMFNQPKHIVSAFLRGVIDGDGSIARSHAGKGNSDLQVVRNRVSFRHDKNTGETS